MYFDGEEITVALFGFIGIALIVYAAAMLWGGNAALLALGIICFKIAR